jgi:hypothetical protein
MILTIHRSFDGLESSMKVFVAMLGMWQQIGAALGFWCGA